LAQLENKLLALELLDESFKYVFFWNVAGFWSLVGSGTLDKRSILLCESMGACRRS